MNMTKSKNTWILSTILIPALISTVQAKTSVGLTLSEIQGARSAALGEAFTAMQDEISAFGYNPASLSTLERGQGSFLYQKGTFEDTLGQVMVGAPTERGGVGLSVSYYNGGTLEILDGTTIKSVNAQTDMVVALGASRKFDHFSLGSSLKYISSELAETAKANAYAIDLGISGKLNSRVNLGFALQNFGSKMTYLNEAEDLPRMARLGGSIQLPMKLATSLMLDTAYKLNEAEVVPSLGLETLFGPMALRAGYKGGSDLENFSVGAGFAFGSSSIDYSFGLVNTLEARHLVSLSTRFGQIPTSPLVKKQNLNNNVKTAKTEPKIKERTFSAAPSKQTLGTLSSGAGSYGAGRGVYVVREGDTLDSIAQKIYGKSNAWPRIYTANKHLIEDPEELPVGKKLILPQ